MKNRLTSFFTDYANRFLTGEAEFDRNILLKRDHSLRVLKEAEALAGDEIPDAGTRDLTAIAALLHDLSRFEQFQKFRTYNDLASFDHGDRSAELTEELHLLDGLDGDARTDILDAIRHHNKLALPETLSPRGGVIARAVRDADKLDIFPILLEYLAQPDNEAVVLNLKPSPELSPAVLSDMLAGRCPKLRDLKTKTDFLVAKLLWVNDLNFRHSLREFRRRDYVRQLAHYLPDTPAVRTIRAAVEAKLAEA